MHWHWAHVLKSIHYVFQPFYEEIQSQQHPQLTAGDLKAIDSSPSNLSAMISPVRYCTYGELYPEQCSNPNGEEHSKCKQEMSEEAEQGRYGEYMFMGQHHQSKIALSHI